MWNFTQGIFDSFFLMSNKGYKDMCVTGLVGKDTRVTVRRDFTNCTKNL